MTDVVLVAIIGVVGTFVGSLTGIISAKIADSSRAKNDNRLYISKTQYDLEYGIYRDCIFLKQFTGQLHFIWEQCH